MRTARVLTVAVVVVAGWLSIAARAETAGPKPRLSLSIVKTRYLSTETVSGSLVIVNTTKSPFVYNATDVQFFIRERDGSTSKRRWITVIRHLLPSTTIAPGHRHAFSIPLPVCEVTSDPCTERVAIALSYSSGVDTSATLLTNEVEYAFVADPAATYQGSGIGGRPLIITEGEASGTILQRILQITIHFVHAPKAYQTTPPEGDAVGEAFASRGLGGGGSGFTTDATGFQIMKELPDHEIDATIDGAIAAVRTRFGTTVDSVRVAYTLEQRDWFPINAIAYDNALAIAQRTSNLLDDGAVARADVPDFRNTLHVELARGGDSDRHASFSITPFDPLPPALASTSKALLDVHVRTTGAFVGERAIGALPQRSTDLRALSYLGSDGSELPGFATQATIATDRPELYAVAQTTIRANDRLGYQPRATATLLAIERVRALAAQLDVDAGPLTLVAIYPERNRAQDVTIDATGVAVAPAGDLDRLWRPLVATPEPRASDSPMRLAIPVAAPTMSPQPPVAPGSVAPPPPRFPIPIRLPEAASQITFVGDVATALSTDRTDASPARCETLALHTQLLSLRDALARAAARARTFGLVLRHLVLVAAYPPSLDPLDACDGGPFAHEAVLHAPVAVTFRLGA